MSKLLTPEVIDDLRQSISLADLPLPRWDAVVAALNAAEAQRKPRLTWSCPQPGVHIINGTRVDSELSGLAAAYLALSRPWRKEVRAADIASSDAAYPGNSVRKAIRVAATFIEPLSAQAAKVMRQIKVTADGFVYFAPDGNVDVIAD